MFRLHALFNTLAMMLAWGQIRNVIIEVPPQHGKSEFWCRYFPAWYLGTHPEHRVVLAMAEAKIARSWGRKVRDIMDAYGPELFNVAVRQDVHAADDWSLDGHEGGMVTAGVEGQITGRRGNLLICDDLIKGPKEANSKSFKAALWDWWESVLTSRENFEGAKVVVSTRWAIDDLQGQIMKKLIDTNLEEWFVVSLPALAEKDEDLLEGQWTREKHDALCPELFPRPFMEAKRAKTSAFWWATTYQQRPYPKGGGDIKSDWFEVVDPEEVPGALAAVRAWDLAASEDISNKQSAGVRIISCADDKFYITDAVYGWWNAGKRDQKILKTAEHDGVATVVVGEQEPGSGGKAQLETIGKLLKGFVFEPVLATGDKMTRADPLASAAQRGLIKLVKGAWNRDFLDQAERFPVGLIDIMDAAAHGYNKVAKMRRGPVKVPGPLNTPQQSAGVGIGSPRIFGSMNSEESSFGGGRIFT